MSESPHAEAKPLPLQTRRNWLALLTGGMAGMASGTSCDSRKHSVPSTKTPRAKGPFAQEAYVWQRVWTPAVVDAVRESTGRVDALTVLAAEVEFQDKTPRLIRPKLDFPAMRAFGNPIAMAMRIGPWAGPFSESDELANKLVSWLNETLQQAREAGWEPSELQIDFDAATSKLAGYETWLRVFQRAVSPLPVSFTALPDWLNSPTLKEMATLTGRYVLQVHAVERARANDTKPQLIHPESVRKWVEQAGKLGVKFHIALPTYRSAVGFNAEGKIIGIDSEGSARAWPKGTRIVTYQSPAEELATLIREWTTDRPASMAGVLWYRLPVAGESRNWSWPTLAAVMQGRAPKVALEIQRNKGNPVDLVLANTGEGEAPWPELILAKLPPQIGTIETGDALAGYAFEWDASAPEAAAFRRLPNYSDAFLPPGGKKPLGWLRLTSDTISHELTIHLKA